MEYEPRMAQAVSDGDFALFKQLANEAHPQLSQACKAALMRQNTPQTTTPTPSERERAASGGMQEPDATSYGPGVGCPATADCILTQ